MLNVGTNDTEKDLTKARFQEELNKWFESRGIIADLRSHLRHLMITALRSTQIGLNPTDKTSPKIQAVDLVVAEYLLRHGCHYTLSVFTSEVPTLNGFTGSSPTGVLWTRKSGAPEVGSQKKFTSKSYFQEAQIDEIFNALGLSSCGEEVERTKTSYFQTKNENSLLELFLQMVLDMSIKLQLRQHLEGYQQSNEGEEGERVLSKKWSSKIVDILLNENIKPIQISAIQQSIVSITENEIKKITEDGHKKQMMILAEREKRIQEHLRKCEDEILYRLMEAEKELSIRKDAIDEELSERQRHLSKMILEWNKKHEEIMKLSKNICNIENENKMLKKSLEEIKKENEDLRIREEEQKETIDKLGMEVHSLKDKLKEAMESKEILNKQLADLLKKENKVSIQQKEEEGEEREMTSFIKNSFAHQPTKDSAEIQIEAPDFVTKVSDKQIIEKSGDEDSFKQNSNSNDEDEISSLSRSPSYEEILSDARKKVQDLEEESSRIKKKYFEYKLVYSRSLDSDSDFSKNSSEKSEKKEHRLTPKVLSENGLEFVSKSNKTSQMGKENKFAEELTKFKEWTERKEKDSFVRPNVFKMAEGFMGGTTTRAPTKRQLKNRDYFLKSRKFLQELEARNIDELQTTTPSVAESSFQATSSDSSSEISERKNVEETEDKSIVMTPLMTASFYCNHVPREEEHKRATVPENPQLDTQFNCLALLEETRIKSPQKLASVSRSSLRQQILLAESEGERLD